MIKKEGKGVNVRCMDDLSGGREWKSEEEEEEEEKRRGINAV